MPEVETRKLYQIHSKSFEEKGVGNFKSLWEKVKEEGFEGFRMSSSLEIQKKDGEKENLFHAIFSTEKKDRHGEIVKQKFDLKAYKKNPVILDSHDYRSIEAIIGKAKRLKSEGKLEGDVEFALDNPRGSLAFKLALGGFLNACSIGFLPKEFSEDFMTIEESELLEISFVSVPANPEALVEKMQKSIEEAEPAEIMRAAEEAKERDEKQGGGEVESPSGIGQTRETIVVESKEIKPYANEHSCRIKDPKKYDSFARKNCHVKHDGKCIDVIFGIKEGKSEIQAYRYDKDVWTESAAKAHCKDKGGAFEPAKGKDMIPAEKVVEEIRKIEKDRQEIRKNVLKNIAREIEKINRLNAERKKGKIFKLIRNLLRE